MQQVRTFQDAIGKSRHQAMPWVIEGLLLEQSATLVSAHPHAMKSLSWLQACLEAIATKRVCEHSMRQTSRTRCSSKPRTHHPGW